MPLRSARALSFAIIHSDAKRLTVIPAIEPATVLAAKFSMPHAVAATTLRGTGGAASFTFDTLQDPDISAMRRRVKLAAYAGAGPPPRDRPARVTWTFHDGEQRSATVESPRGELGVHMVSDGGTRPYRVHYRDPSFTNLQAVAAMCEGGQVADIVGAVASIDPVMGGVDR